jgi:hypothetical protein
VLGAAFFFFFGQFFFQKLFLGTFLFSSVKLTDFANFLGKLA